MTTVTSKRPDVLTTFHFYVEGFGEQAVFTEITGLSVEVMVQDYEEGGQNDYIHRLPGRVKVSDITLRNGVTTSNEILEWFQKILEGKFERRDVTIIMVNQDKTTGRNQKWTFKRALPVKWTGPELKAGQSGAAIQSLQLTHQGLTIT
ncbi:MAG TPA: phage tail protein [Chloroflexia bacterium]|nr:phage tail protein [Chloroflexia bacterium]